jgi:hypothetical protein
MQIYNNVVSGSWRHMIWICVIGVLFTHASPVHSGDMNIYGWAEEVIVYPAEMKFRAKLDSGARTSSINAVKIKEFKKDGEEWVRFTIENSADEAHEMELPVERFVRIREHGGTYQRRPVVKMGICMGDLYKETEVNLIDRSNFKYPLLIGRLYMRGDVLIDSDVTKTREPECKLPAADE